MSERLDAAGLSGKVALVTGGSGGIGGAVVGSAAHGGRGARGLSVDLPGRGALDVDEGFESLASRSLTDGEMRCPV